MEPILLVLLLVALLAGSMGALALSRRRSRGIELEPPPRKPAGRPIQPPRPAHAPEASGAPTGVADVEPDLSDAQVAEIEDALAEAEAEAEAPAPAVKPRFRDRLGKARSLLSGYLGSILSRGVDDQTFDELEEALIRADVGVQLTSSLLDDLRRRAKEENIVESALLVEALKAELKDQLGHADRSLKLAAEGPNVWLFVGVNGVGKTTTIGKLAQREATAGRKIVMAAGDTFRAAAGEQLELWAERTGADIVRGAEGADPGSVIFDAVERAGAKGADLVLADTAGRLHTKVNLMEELKKVRRIAERPPAKLTEVLLVIDATTGQNGLVQAKQFTEAVGCTGVVLTKLDGTAKGGIALAIQAEMGLPIKLVGLGEQAEDLIEFDPDEFVEALLSS